MKKIISILLSGVIFVLTLSSCSYQNPESEEEFSGLKLTDLGESNRPTYDDLKSLEEKSDLIIVGKVTGDSQQEEFYQDENKDILLSVVSTNKVEVLKVIKGDIKEGEILSVTQRYGIIDDRFLYMSRLTPMLNNDNWLFFLTKRENGTCYCTGDNDGRYPLENFSYRKIALTDNEDLGVYDKKDFREDIYKEILEKYDLG